MTKTWNIILYPATDARFAKWQKRFIFFAGGLLLLAAFAKFSSIHAAARILNLSDPVLGLSFRTLILLSGLLDLCVSVMCLFSNRAMLSLAALLWQSSVFAAYRFGLWYVHWEKPCPCLGTLTGAIHLSPALADDIAIGAEGLFVIGSIVCWAASNVQNNSTSH